GVYVVESAQETRSSEQFLVSRKRRDGDRRSMETIRRGRASELRILRQGRRLGRGRETLALAAAVSHRAAIFLGADDEAVAGAARAGSHCTDAARVVGTRCPPQRPSRARFEDRVDCRASSTTAVVAGGGGPSDYEARSGNRARNSELAGSLAATGCSGRRDRVRDAAAKFSGGRLLRRFLSDGERG